MNNSDLDRSPAKISEGSPWSFACAAGAAAAITAAGGLGGGLGGCCGGGGTASMGSCGGDPGVEGDVGVPVLRVLVALLMEVEVVRLHLRQLRLQQDVDKLEIVGRRGSLVLCPGCLVRAQIASGALVLLVVPVLEMGLVSLVIALVLCR